jgi:hypothetical protein
MIVGNPMRFGSIGIAGLERNDGLGGILFDMMQMEMLKWEIYHLFFMPTDEQGRRFYERYGTGVFCAFTSYRFNRGEYDRLVHTWAAWSLPLQIKNLSENKVG